MVWRRASRQSRCCRALWRRVRLRCSTLIILFALRAPAPPTFLIDGFLLPMTTRETTAQDLRQSPHSRLSPAAPCNHSHDDGAHGKTRVCVKYAAVRRREPAPRGRRLPRGRALADECAVPMPEQDVFWFHSTWGGMGNDFFDARGLISRVSAKQIFGCFFVFWVFWGAVLGGVFVLLGVFFVFRALQL